MAVRPYNQGAWNAGAWPHTPQIFEVAVAIQLAFQVQPGASMLFAYGAASSIQFSVWEWPRFIIQGYAETMISFSVQGELVWSWPMSPPCETGTWKLAA